ncbi:MAG: GAF domain-containing protein [Chloroflexi bacterium]|nr:GAF domain-containing protein [Chloroflexota bacterium]
MTFPAAFARWLAVQSDDETIIQKGRLTQNIIIALTAVSLLSALANLSRHLAANNAVSLLPALAELLITPLFALSALYIVRRGQPVWAAHFFFIVLNTIFFIQFVASGNITTLPYLMLISVLGIATIDSVRSSMVYTALIIASMSAYYLFADNAIYTLTDLLAYVLTTLSIGFTAWVSASAMRRSLRTANQLAAEQKKQTDFVQRRAQQLQRVTAVSQTASALLDLEELLRDTVYTVRDQFGFYFAAIYLLDDDGQHLTLREATGAVGGEMKTRRYQIDLDAPSIVGWVAQHGEARLARDVLADPVFFNEPLLRETRSELALPLQTHGRILGVLDVQSREPDAFPEEDLAVLQIMTNQVAGSIDNARLFARTEQHLNETQTLLTLSTNLATTLDVGEIYRRAARTFAQQFTANACTITLWDQANNALRREITYTRWEDGRTADKFNLTSVIYDLAEHPGSAQVLQTGQPWPRQLGDAHLSDAESHRLTDAGHASSLEVALLIGSQAQGSIIIFRGPDQRPFTAAETQLAQVMANETAIALSNAQLASEARGRVAQLSALNRLSQALSLAPTLHDIFDSARREVFSLFEATAMSVILVTPDGQHLNWIFAYEYGQEVDLSGIPPLDVNQGFSGEVVRSRQYLLINRQVAELAEKYQSITVGAPSSTWLGFPLIVANELIGVLAIENENDSDAFGERDVQLLETIAGSLAIALNNHLQLEAVQHALLAQSIQRNQLQTAAEIAAATTSILQLDQLLERAVNLIQERFSLYYTGLFLIDAASQEAVLQAATGEAGRIQLQKGHHLTVGGRSLIGGATADGQPRITQDVYTDAEWRANPHLPATRSELALPLRVHGHIIGALTVQSVEPNAFGAELIGVLQTMSDQLAIAIDNTRLLADAENRTRRQRELTHISAQLHNTADLDEIIHIGLKAISERVAGQPVALNLGTRQEGAAGTNGRTQSTPDTVGQP